MDENNVKKFKKDFTNDVNKIKDIIEAPRLYLSDYFENIKSILDVSYIKRAITDKEVTKEWLQIIDIIENKCLSKCLLNKLPIEVINEANDKLTNIEWSNDSIVNLEDKLNEIKTTLESYLLLNDSFVVFYLNDKKKSPNSG